jgi:hypothetical protein
MGLAQLLLLFFIVSLNAEKAFATKILLLCNVMLNLFQHLRFRNKFGMTKCAGPPQKNLFMLQSPFFGKIGKYNFGSGTFYA